MRTLDYSLSKTRDSYEAQEVLRREESDSHQQTSQKLDANHSTL